MQFVAKSRHVRYSPLKLRPLVDEIRGKNVGYALNWLATCALQKALPIKKVVASAAANASSLGNVDKNNLFVKEIRIDQGRSFRYFRPGAMGRSSIFKKRTSHISVVLEPIVKKEEA